MLIVVFTAAIGMTDVVRPPRAIDPQARYVCFSDQPCTVPPYEWIPVPVSSTPMLAARRLKILADHPVLQEADLTLWHDASYQLRRTLRWLRLGLSRAEVIAMRHPRRSTIEDEALIIARYGYVTVEEARAHVARYRAEGFADRVLTASGLLGRVNSPAVRAFNAIWWDEAQRWRGRDQGSVDFAAWRAGVRVWHFPGTVRNNRMALWRTPQAVAVSA